MVRGLDRSVRPRLCKGVEFRRFSMICHDWNGACGEHAADPLKRHRLPDCQDNSGSTNEAASARSSGNARKGPAIGRSLPCFFVTRTAKPTSPRQTEWRIGAFPGAARPLRRAGKFCLKSFPDNGLRRHQGHRDRLPCACGRPHRDIDWRPRLSKSFSGTHRVREPKGGAWQQP